jgi:serine/threonine-protein kinase
MKLDAITLKQLSPLLDEALELEASKRDAWLARLGGEAAKLVPALRELLSKTSLAQTDALLERGPAFTLPGTAEHVSEFRPGDRVGPYSLIREIGQGGMGEVWQAERADGTLKREVALKLPMLSLRRKILLQRFDRERDILSGLVHPNVARLYDAGFSDNGQPFLALEYVEGQPITDYCERAHCDTRTRIQLLLQVMRAVQYAHANLVIHRDLKPTNVLVTNSGSAMLLDFGIAKLLEDASGEVNESALTQLGGRALTLDYASPEQISGTTLSTATDVYSLGVILFELLAGRRPFNGPKRERENAILTETPVLPSNIAPDLANIVAKALKKMPNERYSTVGAFAEDLQRWLDGDVVLAQPDSRLYRVRKFVARYRFQVTLTAAASVALIALATVAVLQGLKAREETKRAIAARDFLVDMFRLSDTDGLKGKEFTAKQLLSQGKLNLLATLNQEPALQVEVLRAIANAELNLSEYRTAEATLTEVAQRYQALGAPIQQGHAIVSKAAAVFLAGETPRAKQILEDAWILLRAHQSDPSAVQTYYQILSAVSVRDRNVAIAEDASIKSLAMAEKLYGKNHLQTIRALSALGRMRSWNREYEAARQHFDDALERANETPTFRPRDRIWLAAERAEVSVSAGHFRAASEQYTFARQQCANLLDASSQLCRNLVRGEAAVLLLLGQKEEAMALLPNYRSLLDNEEAPLDQMEALMTACRTLILAGRVAGEPEWWARLSQLANSGAAQRVDDRHKIWALLIETERALYEQQFTVARKLLKTAESRLASDVLPTNRELIRIRLYQGVAAQQAGEHEQALNTLTSVTESYAKLLGPMHTRTLLSSLHQAGSLVAVGRREEALSLIDCALPRLQETMGSSSPMFQRIVRLRDEIANQKRPSANTSRHGIFM